jgi:hypothetical protein
MKALERMLQELDAKNMEKNISQIQGQLEYYAKSKQEVEGISLILVVDLLNEGSHEALRSNGYALTINQLMEDCEKFLILSKKSPILYNATLKRLYRSILVFQENYVLGNIKNKAAILEIKKQFSKKFQDIYCGHHDSNKKLPKELSNLISNQITEEIKRINAAWYRNALQTKINKLFTQLLFKQLLSDWHDNKLDEIIVKKLIEEKKTINSAEALINCFRENKLPEEIQIDIKKYLASEIVAEVNADRINVYDDLGAAIKVKSTQVLQNELSFTVNAVITDWKNNQTHTNVSKQIEKHLAKILNNMKDRLDSSLTQQFETLAVKAFLDKLQQGQYETSLGMEKYSLTIGKWFLTSYSEADNVNDCWQGLFDNAMSQLHDQWIAGKLTSDVNNYLQEIVFSSLNKINELIQGQVWQSDSNNRIERLEKQVQEQNQLFQQQAKLIQQLLTKLETISNLTIQANEQDVRDEKTPSHLTFFK